MTKVYVFAVGFRQFFALSEEAAALSHRAWERQLKGGYGPLEALSPVWETGLTELAPCASPVIL